MSRPSLLAALCVCALVVALPAATQAQPLPAPTSAPTAPASPAPPAQPNAPTGVRTEPSSRAQPAVSPPAPESAVAVDNATLPAPPSAATPSAPSSAPATAVPAPWDSAFRELQELELREHTLEHKRSQLSVVGPATGITIGTALTLALVPIGAVLIYRGNSDEDGIYSGSSGMYYSDKDPGLRNLGAAVLTAGVLGLATAIYSIWHLNRTRDKRRALDTELTTVHHARQTLLQAHAPPPTPQN